MLISNLDTRCGVGADLAQLLSAWGELDSEFDLDGDGTITGGDLSILLGNWTS